MRQGEDGRTDNRSKDAVQDPSGLHEATIELVHHAFRNGSLSCAGLIDYYLARIAAYDRAGPQLRTLITLNPQARILAAEQDARLRTSGTLAGPLHGIPLVVKDNFNTIDMPTTGGCAALAAAAPGTESAVTRKLRAAGAIILGKANMHELALSGTTVSSLGGQTKNPYDLSRTPGGSSGGTGAAIAANFCIAGMGTDTVNSIRSPASANCLVGLRPTRGLVSRAGVMPVSETQDAVGPLARTVADAAILLDVIAGFDPADPVTARCIGHVPDTYARLDRCSLAGARIGMLCSFMGTGPEHSEVNEAIHRAVDTMLGQGAEIVWLEDLRLDADTLLKDYDVQRWEFRSLLNAYLSSLGRDCRVRTLDEFIADGRYHRPSLEALLKNANVMEEAGRDAEYQSRMVKIHHLRDRLLLEMAIHGLDAIAYPLQRRLVVPIGELNQAERNGILAALTGFPAITVPAGFSRPTREAPLGIPIGMDIMSRPFTEAGLLNIAYAFEQASKIRRPPDERAWMARY